MAPKWKRHWLKTLPAAGFGPVLPRSRSRHPRPSRRSRSCHPGRSCQPRPSRQSRSFHPDRSRRPSRHQRCRNHHRIPPRLRPREPPIELLVDAIVAPPLPPLAVVFGLVVPPVLAGPSRHRCSPVPSRHRCSPVPSRHRCSSAPSRHPRLLPVLPPDTPAVPSEPPALTVPAIALEPSASLPPVDHPASWLGAHPDAAR